MKKSRLQLVCGLYLFFPISLWCQTLEHKLNLSRYESALVSGFPSALWIDGKYHRPDPDYLKRDRGWKNPVDQAARALLHDRIFQNKEKVPHEISNILQMAILVYPLLYLPRQGEPRYEFHSQPFTKFDDAAFLFSYAESQAVNLLLTNIVKVAARRHRPWLSYRNFDSPFYEHADRETANQSFFSGHTSTAFTSASFHHRMLQRFRGKHFGDAEVWGVYLAAAVTGLMRIGADKHYLTDTVAGAVMGTLVGRWVVDISKYEIVDPGAAGSAPSSLSLPIFAVVVNLP
jgi:hypothetical protein